jgi:hypothetical protein
MGEWIPDNGVIFFKETMGTRRYARDSEFMIDDGSCPGSGGRGQQVESKLRLAQ